MSSRPVSGVDAADVVHKSKLAVLGVQYIILLIGTVVSLW